jgi:hypothetical protein
MALTAFPLAFPQLTRLATGWSVSDSRFRRHGSLFCAGFPGPFTSARTRAKAARGAREGGKGRSEGTFSNDGARSRDGTTGPTAAWLRRFRRPADSWPGLRRVFRQAACGQKRQADRGPARRCRLWWRKPKPGTFPLKSTPQATSRRTRPYRCFGGLDHARRDREEKRDHDGSK